MTAKIKLNAGSGGGSFSLQAPSSSSNNRVMTLPDTADGTILTTTNPKSSNIIQVVSTNVTTTSSSVLSNYPTLVESPATITFNSVGLNSRFVVSGQVGGEANIMDHAIGFVLTRTIGGTTTNINVGTPTGNRPGLTRMMSTGYGGTNSASTPSSTNFAPFTDSPNQAAGTSIKYAFQVCKINQSGTLTFYFGRSTNDTDTADYERLPCNITVFEVAA